MTTNRHPNMVVGAPHAGVSPPLPGWCRSPRSLSLPRSWPPHVEVACSPPCRSWCSRPRAGTVSAGSSCRSPSPQQQSRCCCLCECQKNVTWDSIGTHSFCMILWNLVLKLGNHLPYDVKKLLSDCKYGQILSLFQQSLLLCELTVCFTFFFHVVGKLLLSSVQRRVKEKIFSSNQRGLHK